MKTYTCSEKTIEKFHKVLGEGAERGEVLLVSNDRVIGLMLKKVTLIDGEQANLHFNKFDKAIYVATAKVKISEIPADENINVKGKVFYSNYIKQALRVITDRKNKDADIWLIVEPHALLALGNDNGLMLIAERQGINNTIDWKQIFRNRKEIKLNAVVENVISHNVKVPQELIDKWLNELGIST
ncbi:MAG: hypothetical protein NDF55_10615 [archaeon GB-1867-005]|nr:hypothetical protein [Candidatus Culexmicrobium cathedralense]